MSGITRIHIDSDNYKKESYLKAERIGPFADEVYRDVFPRIELPLIDDRVTIAHCNFYSKLGRLDWQKGIDIIMTCSNYGEVTTQEKLLTYQDKTTLTVETIKGNGKRGAWYYCEADFYTTMYCRDYDNCDYSLRAGIIVDWKLLKEYDKKFGLPWHHKKDGPEHDNNNFKYLDFDEIPEELVIWRF